MWMISLSSALTLFLILNICKVFVISSASMVWASTLISVHLQWIILVWESQVDYLGMRVWGSGDYPLVKHTEIISTFSCSTDKKGLQHFLGILNFYRRFIQCAPRILHPLTEALKGKPSVLTWNLEMNQFFEASKSVMANFSTLVLMLQQSCSKKYPAPVFLFTDHKPLTFALFRTVK